MERRRLLEGILADVAGQRAGSTSRRRRSELAVAADWFARFEGAGLDGVVAKALGTCPTLADKRAMVKVKHERTAEFVVAGFRWYRKAAATGKEIGSLLLGLVRHHRPAVLTSASSGRSQTTSAGSWRRCSSPTGEGAGEGPPVGGLGLDGARA